ncbi:MAG: hypothetical protein FWH53_07555, partial [Leptospirales bacterium]|nr:hypothetical protein [Leptospirales bacterium]
MNKGMVYKLIFILSLIVFAVLLILPTVGTKSMEVRFYDSATEQDIDSVKERFSSDQYEVEVNDKTIRVSGRNVTDAIMNEMKIYNGVADAKILDHWVQKFLPAKKITLGLDLQGGMYLALQADFEDIEKRVGRELTEKDKSEITQQALEIIRNRIDKFGVSEPSIRPRGNEAIEVQLPGVKDPTGVKKAFGDTGTLEYKLVDDTYSNTAMQWFAQNYKDKTLPERFDDLVLIAEEISKAINLPAALEVLFDYERDQATGIVSPKYPLVVQKDISLSGTDIREATVDRDERGRVVVAFKTTADGALKFAQVTSEKNHGKRLAIVLDKKIRSAPAIQTTITAGAGTITGSFSYNEALALARVIKEGALPVS